MSKSKRATMVAFMEEAEEDSGSSVEGREGTRVYAYSEAPMPPSKEMPNTGKSRLEHRPSGGRRGDSFANNSDSSSRSARREREKEARRLKEHEREIREMERRKKEEKREREARRAKAEEKAARESSKALKKVRPSPLKHSQTQPVVQQAPGYRRAQFDEPSYYGVQQPAVSGSRPRANTRPASYYAGQPRPPPSNASWQSSPMPPPPFPIGSFPPPPTPPMYPHGPPPGMPGPMPGGMPPPSPGGPVGPPGPGYFDGPPPPMHPGGGRDLRQRFDHRPSSAMGFQRPPSRGFPPDDFYGYEGFDGYDDEQSQAPKRSSRVKKQQQDEDRKRMPPPEYKPMRNMPRRPSTTANPTTPFQPPPARPASRAGGSRPPRAAQRRSVGFVDLPAFDDDSILGGEDDLFHDISPQPSYEDRRRAMARSRRDSPIYDDDDDDYDIIPASTHRSRRGSVYGGAPLSSGGASLDADRYHEAMKYQEDVSGGPPLALTAESLRKANKRGEGVPSSRSTRSSGSRDESEYKRSSTTGITRSSSGNNGDDFTIKVSGAALVRVHGAEIECEDSEITFSNGASSRGAGASDQSTVYQLEDSRSRPERKALPHRPRAPSQSDSQSRGYAPSHAPYDYNLY